MIEMDEAIVMIYAPGALATAGGIAVIYAFITLLIALARAFKWRGANK